MAVIGGVLQQIDREALKQRDEARWERDEARRELDEARELLLRLAYHYLRPMSDAWHDLWLQGDDVPRAWHYFQHCIDALQEIDKTTVLAGFKSKRPR